MSLAEAVAACRHALVRLRHKQVEILRVGLEPENDLQCGPEILAGPYDSDLRLLVEADLMRSRAVDALTSAFALGTRAFTFVVNPREENYLRGRCNENLRLLREQFRLESVHVVSSEEQVMGTLRVYAGQFTASDIPPGRPRKAS